MNANPLRRRARAALLFVGALLFLVEEWIWNAAVSFFEWLGRHRATRWIEDRLRRLPGWAALAALVLPMLLLFPVKVAALWMIATGRVVTGCTVALLAKLLSTAVIARIFLTCKPQLMSMRWFCRLHAWIVELRQAVHAWLARQPGWHATLAAIRRARAHVRAWGRGKSHRRAQEEGLRDGALRRWRGQRRRALVIARVDPRYGR